MFTVLTAMVVPVTGAVLGIGPLLIVAFLALALLGGWLVSGMAEEFRRMAAREWEQEHSAEAPARPPRSVARAA